jgi:hypothetical protein
MTIGELWVQSPLFPILVWILAAWVLFATAVFVRTWYRLLRLERYTKLLESLVTEGVGNVAKQIKELKEAELNQRGKRKKRRRRRRQRGQSAIQPEAERAAEIETITEDSEVVTSSRI